jgi:hypothetical protein
VTVCSSTEIHGLTLGGLPCGFGSSGSVILEGTPPLLACFFLVLVGGWPMFNVMDCCSCLTGLCL